MTAAMVVFGMLTVNTAKSFQVTTDTMVRSDLEYRAVATAQDEIDSIRWVQSRYKSQDPFDPTSNYYMYEENPIERTITFGSGGKYSETVTIDRSTSASEDCTLLDANTQRCYEITIKVQSNTVSPAISVSQKLVRTLTFEN